MWKLNFEKKFLLFPLRISVSCTTQECDNITTSYYPISALFSIIYQMVAYRRLTTKENFKLLALKVVAVVYKRWSLTTGSKYRDMTWKLLLFWKTSRGEVVAYERCSLTRGSKYSDSTWKPFVLWKTGSSRRGGRLREVVNRRFDCITNRPFYSGPLGDLAFELQRGWRRPCFDTDLAAFVM